MNTSARFTHDCDNCQFIGVTSTSDLYSCKDEDLIIRHSSLDFDNASRKISDVRNFYNPKTIGDFEVALQLYDAKNNK